jgi:hypothetical protein
MATSFPYLTVSRFCGVPYWQVLRYAELLDEFPPKPEDWYLQPWQVHTIVAWRQEQDRRKAAQPQMVQWSKVGDFTSWEPDPSIGSTTIPNERQKGARINSQPRP